MRKSNRAVPGSGAASPKLLGRAKPAHSSRRHPISYFQAVILGLTQGIAEPFPISSLGHAVVLPALFGWNIHQNDKFFLTFLIATHFATAIVFLIFFFKDWVLIVKGILRSLRMREIREDDTYARLGWLLVAGTIPVGIIGLLLQDPLRKLFASPSVAAAFLIVNGIALLAFERLRRRPPRPGDYLGDSDARLAKLSWRQTISDRHLAGRRADPRHLALRHHDGRRPAVGPLERGRRALRVPAGDARDLRRGGPEAARTARSRRLGRPRPGARRRPVRGRSRRSSRSSSCCASSRPTG